MAGDTYDGPTRERLGKGDLERAGRGWYDDHGKIGLPYLVVSALTRMARKKTITERQKRAGELFAADFAIGKFDPRHAPDLRRIPGQHAGEDGAIHIAAARIRIHDALKVLGGNATELGSCAWHVLGCEDSIRRWARQQNRDQKHCAGILIAVLVLLVIHYRLGPPA